MKTVVIIPARYSSTRYPGKPLVPLLGKPMILWVAELAAKAIGKENTFIATEDNRIAEVVRQGGFQAVMTDPKALTGTDRLAEAAATINADIYINVQGDEPLVKPDDICAIRDAKHDAMSYIINGYCWVSANEDPYSINLPKVITNEADKLVYMSRCALPGFKDQCYAPMRYKKQVCIYAFTKQELIAFQQFGRKSYLEQCEDIEILRFLELEKDILMVETQPGSLAVDIPEDVPVVEQALKNMHKNEY